MRNTSEIDRVKIKTAKDAGLCTPQIFRRYGFTPSQIYYALPNPTKPKTNGNGGKLIPNMAPELELEGRRKKAI